jgi:hypothetical protein
MKRCTAVLEIEGRTLRCQEPAGKHPQHEAGMWYRDGLWVKVSWGLADPPRARRRRARVAKDSG